MNLIYPDGSGKLDVGTRALQVPMPVLVQLIRAGAEFFLFEGGAFHVEHDTPIERTLARVLGHDRQKKQRKIAATERAPTRVSRVLVTDPEGNEYEINNLLGWMKEQFPERYKSLYFAAIRRNEFAGYKIRHLGWVTMTVMGNEDFVKNMKDANGKRSR